MLLAALAVLLVLATWHYVTLARDATAARTALLDLEDTMQVVTDLGLDATPEDLDVIEGKLTQADARIDGARAHLHWDPLLQAMRWLPAAGDQVIAASAFLDIADALVEAGLESTTLARTAIEAHATNEDGAPIASTAMELLDGAGPAIERVDALVARAVAARLEVGDRALLGPLDDARARIDEHLPRIVTLTDQALAARSVLPDLLGFEGERRYLVLSLNNAELMPGGGLVTVAGTMTVEDGHVRDTTFHNSATWLPEWREAGGDYLEPPAPLERHLLRGYSWNLGVANWDPDFGVWARQALELYEMAWGPQDVDGVVAVDLDVLEAFLDITGGETVEAPGFGEIHVTSDNAFLELERVTRAPSDTWRRSKAAVGALQEALLRDVLELPASQWGELAKVVRRLGNERHLQVLLLDPEAQALIDDLGWDGRLLAPPGDYLQVNEASVNSTKLNAVFAPTATYDIDVTALGAARHDLTLRYENTVEQWAEDLDPELVSHLMFDGQYGGYVRAFVPRDATGFAATLDGRPAAIEDEATTEAHRWAGVYVPVPPGATRELGLRWSVPMATDDPDTYEITLQKQPGTRGLCIDLRVRRAGTPAATVTIEGGSRDRDGRLCLTTDATVHATFEASETGGGE